MTVVSRRSRDVLLRALLLTATAILFIVSRGKWSDPLVDSGREWLVPDALARGRLLYRDVVYWFGPLTPYVHASFFRVFGSGFGTLALAGVLSAAAAVAALYALVARVADRAFALSWAALAIPALVFMPNAGGAIVGMGYRIWHAAVFSLLALVLVSGDFRKPSWAVAVAGACTALAGLCRVEWGLAALASSALVLVRRRPQGQAKGSPAVFAALAAGFVVVFGGAWALLLPQVGWRAVLVEQPVFLLHIPSETPAGSGLAALRPWRAGIPNLLYSASVWYGAAQAIALLALRSRDPSRRRAALEERQTRIRLWRLAGALGVAAIGAALGALGGAVLFSAAPLACAAALVAGWRGGRTPRAAALVGVGAMGLLASHRRLFFLGDAPYVAPPLLFAFAAGAGLLWLFVRDEASPEDRPRLEFACCAAVAGLAALTFASRILTYGTYGSAERVPIGGTAGMLTAPPGTARAIESVASSVRERTPSGSGMVVFPEGELLNFLAERPNPLRHALYLPGYLTDANEAEVLAALAAARPAAIVVWRRPVPEYSRGLFGSDYGRRIAEWIRQNYAEAAPPAGATRATAPFELYLLRGGPS